MTSIEHIGFHPYLQSLIGYNYCQNEENNCTRLHYLFFRMANIVDTAEFGQSRTELSFEQNELEAYSSK